MTDRLLTPSKITAWLDCAHFLTLKHRVDDGLLVPPGPRFGSLAQLLADKGLEHESNCLTAYAAQGKSIFTIPAREQGEPFSTWVERVGHPFHLGYDVIAQMPLLHDGIRGIADFLIRVEDPEWGGISYEPVDAKLARAEAKPGHVLQLCFYAEALEALTGHRPRTLHLWLGSGRVESLVADDFRPYWNRMRRQLAAALSQRLSDAPTVPEPCRHCEFCEFAELCDSEWRAHDSLVYLAGIRTQDRGLLESADVSTLAALAELAGREASVAEIRTDRLDRLIGQATLQVKSRQAPTDTPAYQLIVQSEDQTWGQGFSFLPAPDDGDVFLDFEGHPFWRADTGLFFLFGFILRQPDGEWTYHARWAHDLAEEATATHSLIVFLAEQRAVYPGMHVYHYNHTERSALERLAADHGVGEVALAELVETGLFIDLLLVVRNALQLGAETYGLKDVERLTAFERGHEIDQGAGAVVEYEAFTKTRDPAVLARIASYNEDDVRATRAVRDWLVDRRPEGLVWRTAFLEPDKGVPDLDAHITRLHAFEPGTPEHLLGHVVGYWRREWLAHLAPKLARCQSETAKLLDEADALAGLVAVGLVARTGKNGGTVLPVMRFRFPEQTAAGFGPGENKVIYNTPNGPVGYATVNRLDLATHELDLVWNQSAQDVNTIPSVVVLNDWVSPNPKPAALSDLAIRMLDPTSGKPNEVSVALLRRDLPAFAVGNGPPGGTFSDDLDEMTEWVRHLDHSYVAIQGPPGTGKTFRGSHLIKTLIESGRRVGITAMSHNAIDNLLEAIVDLFQQEGDLETLRAVRRVPSLPPAASPGVTYTVSNAGCTKPEFNLVAGTTWLFAGREMQRAPVDVLIVDEAGQLALADALAASRSAESMVFLGDPLQLPQVSVAFHPGDGGKSVLEHLLGDEVTMPTSRGVFLAETRRMHPDVCSFLSEQIYESRLSSHPSCAVQATEFGTGLRWIPANHSGRSTASAEEAALVGTEITRLIGTRWTNQRGEESVLTVKDFMVVAPFNDQVKLLRERLDQEEATRGVPVGTVDKFQGREAAVVFFTMTTSSGQDMTRGAEFLFSRHRLNVAVSRARCLAYLVCTESLLNIRARTVEEMRLISTLCSFVEHVR